MNKEISIRHASAYFSAHKEPNVSEWYETMKDIRKLFSPPESILEKVTLPKDYLISVLQQQGAEIPLGYTQKMILEA
jgi:hypothetical protein